MRSPYRALLISNSEFPEDRHNLFSLQGPVNDCPLLRDALTDRRLGLFDPQDVRLLPERSKRDIVTTIEQFFRTAERDDQLLLYYSGHGLPDINGNLYLCARDTVTTSLVATAISDSEINAIINLSVARAVIIILDCCYSGAFKGPLPTGLRGEGRFVITSCRRAQLASDAELVTGASPFTGYLVEGLRLGSLDADGDGYVALNDLYDYALRQLRPTGQIPQRHFHEAVGDLILARARQPGMHTPAPPAGRPVLAISTNEIRIDDVLPGEILPAEIIDVFNLGGGELDWTATTEADWVTVEAQTGWFRLTMNPRPGGNRANVLVRDRRGGGSQVLRVYVQVRTQPSALPCLALSEQEIDFGNLSQGAKCSQRTVRLINQGSGQLQSTAQAVDSRIRVDQLDDALEVQVDTAVAGPLDGEILVHSNGGDARIRVRARVEPGPVLAIDPRSVDFGRVLAGQQSEKLVRVINAGRGDLDWTHGSTGEFFTVQRDAGGLRLRHDGQPPGRYHGSIWIHSNGGELSFDVKAEVIASELPRKRPDHLAPTDGRLQTIRHHPVLTIAVAMLLVIAAGALGGWITRERQIESLSRLVADFRSKGFPSAEIVPFDSGSGSEYEEYQLAILRELHLVRGVRWRSKHPQTDQVLEVRIFQFETPAQAQGGQDRLSMCPGVKPFPTPGLTAAKGRQCVVDDLTQELTFTKGARLYKLKLSRTSRSTDEILDLSRIQERVAR
jgi:hypothetical protein